MRLYIYLHKDGGVIAIKGDRKPNNPKKMYVVYEPMNIGFCMPPFPELPGFQLFSDKFIYVGSIPEKNKTISIY